MKILFIGNGFDLAHEDMPRIEFEEFVKSNSFILFLKENRKYRMAINKFKKMDQCKLWSSFENNIQYILDEYINSNNKRFYERINIAFAEWIAFILENVKYENINTNKYIEENVVVGVDLIVSYNYTKTPLIYGFKEKYFHHKTSRTELYLTNLKGHFANIHQFNSDHRISNYILGSDQSSSFPKDSQIAKWGEENKEYNPKSHIFKNISEVDELELLFYGFSFGLSDSSTIEKIFGIWKSKNGSIKISVYALNNDAILKIKNNLKSALKGRKGVKDFVVSILFIKVI
ncbi:MAG: hypothetical protein ACRC4L_02855 [Mycoplasma sp.]